MAEHNTHYSFIIFPKQPEQFYETDVLIQCMMNSIVHFEYLKRSKCIVAILETEDNSSKESKKHLAKFEKKLHSQKEMLKRNLKNQKGCKQAKSNYI